MGDMCSPISGMFNDDRASVIMSIIMGYGEWVPFEGVILGVRDKNIFSEEIVWKW
jgi:hypothetical protein